MKHWTEPKGADKELIEAIGAVTDPLEALECVSYMASYIGDDPYYRDFNRAVWAMVARVTGAHESGATPPPPPAP